jgi:lipopolysaccharide assembly outer membrane protein LptD (OstA)
MNNRGMMMKNFLILFLILFLISGVAIAQDETTSNNDTVHLRAGHLKYVGDEIEVSKSVTIIKGDNVIKAPRGKLYKKEDKAILKDGIILEHSKGKVSSEEMLAWLKTDKYIFKKNVNFNRQAEGTKDLELQTSYLEMSLADNSFHTDKGVVIHYDQKVIKAQQADYNDQNETLYLQKDVLVQEENGDWTKGDQATFYLGSEQEEFVMDGNIEIEIGLSEDEEK